jgi:hypothetical protein
MLIKNDFLRWKKVEMPLARGTRPQSHDIQCEAIPFMKPESVRQKSPSCQTLIDQSTQTVIDALCRPRVNVQESRKGHLPIESRSMTACAADGTSLETDEPRSDPGDLRVSATGSVQSEH